MAQRMTVGDQGLIQQPMVSGLFYNWASGLTYPGRAKVRTFPASVILIIVL